MIGADDDLDIHRLVPRRVPRPEPSGDWMPPIFKLSAFWRGCAVVRREHEPGTAAIYERIAAALEAGQKPEDIDELRAWLNARTRMGAAGV